MAVVRAVFQIARIERKDDRRRALSHQFRKNRQRQRGCGAGDVITFPKEDDVRVIEVVAIGERRGPAVEAQTLYVDLSPPVKKEKGVYVPNPEAERSGRPNRQERDAMRKFKGE